MDPTNPARTAGQVEALKAYDEACRELAAAALALQEAQQSYDLAQQRYRETYGAAKALKVIS